MTEKVAALRSWHAEDGSNGQRLYLWCPGCNDLHAAEVGAGQPCWAWNGELEAVTLEPSLKVTGVQWNPEDGFYKPTHNVASGEQIVCHSFVRDGEWEFLGDCTHHLVGQTVPLPPLPDIWEDRWN